MELTVLRSVLALTAMVVISSVASAQSDNSGPKDAGELVATQIREQGYDCKDPVKAKRDDRASKPNEEVWNLSCHNASYRVHLVPDMAARVEKTD